ncbi:HNH endonuclease signature motif containing protein [Rhodococcus wratislaviensis]|uniref:HNH endonuclease signature motif containing protein n=1 Tax=Rhodococcus wratislaviensis TaxID=44752 RepID=UPI003515C7E9
MPTRPPSRCSRCHKPYKTGGRCPACFPPFAASAWRTGTTLNRRRWARVRMIHLTANPLCAWPGCKGLAHEVDHRLNLADHPDISPYDYTNLQSLCTEHHRVKTGREGAARATGKGNHE